MQIGRTSSSRPSRRVHTCHEPGRPSMTSVTTDVCHSPEHRSRIAIASPCDTVLATRCRPRRVGNRVESEEVAQRRGLVDGAITALVFYGALRCSEVAALCWADVDLFGGDEVVVTLRRPKANPLGEGAGVWYLVGGLAAAVRRLHAALSPARYVAGVRSRDGAVNRLMRRVRGRFPDDQGR